MPLPENSPAVPQSEVSRREFLAAGAGSFALAVIDNCCEAAPALKLGTHHIPPDKNLDPAWVEQLFDKGVQRTYSGEDLTCIGMPIGGICAGQLYLRGDGTLAEWGIFNVDRFTGFGENCYRTYTPTSPVQQGFGLSVARQGEKPVYRTLDKHGFSDIEFIGEYPIGQVHYRKAQPEPIPVDVSFEAFSPFVPLDARDSAIPGTILRFQFKNMSRQQVEVTFGGWIQNPVGQRHAGRYSAVRTNRVVREPGLTSLLMGIREKPRMDTIQKNPPIVFADFESGSYAPWKKTGAAFGNKPATGTLLHQQKVSGFSGKGLVNTFMGGDATIGTLTSPEFAIERRYISFRIGGGNNPAKTCLNLLCDGQIIRTATGKNNEKLEWDFWEVNEYLGRKAVLEIVDHAAGGWGHINVDEITFADALPNELKLPPLDRQPDFGTLAFSILDDRAIAAAGGFENFLKTGKLSETGESPIQLEFPLGSAHPEAGVADVFTLEPGGRKEITVLITWHFAGGEHGRMYGNWFADALAAARYLRDHLARLTGLTRLFHDTYFDSTLPYWLLARVMMPISTLATNTVQWRRNGRFWAWEGVGCCDGTCTHVWNYAQGMARLFPELERSARTMQDLGVGFDARTGRVGFRGENPTQPYAADGQCGTVLKCYREHLMSKDGTFLHQNWPKIKQVMEYEIGRDQNDDGVIEDKQWNTYDLDFVGPNTFIGALYLAALKAAANMADLVGDQKFARRCRALAEKGSRWAAQNLWNGEYFVQHIPRGASSKFQYGTGCLSDQLFGQTWADQVGLGRLYPADKIQTALKSIYRYNWASDVAAQNAAHPPQRWFARPGDAGLFTCTWPKGGRMPEPVLYRDEIWTGIEYQVAAGLFCEGMIREGLSIIRGIHDRYDGKRHNPWNEVECGDHYARALASWSCLIALAGFHYDGPAGRLGFVPRWQPENFAAFFTAAEGWGTIRQTRSQQAQTNSIAVAHGQVSLRELELEMPQRVKNVDAKVEIDGKQAEARTALDGRRVRISLTEVVKTGQTLLVTMGW